jgi:molecular chaperone HtpG
MDKSEAATTAKVSNHIYDDVALVILSKLPIKSLFRFSCVRKSWSVLFQNSYFMDMFRRNFISKDHSYYNDTSLILYRVCYTQHNALPELHSLFGERFENKLKIDWPNPLEYTDFHPFGAVDGILCMESADRGRVLLWNPATHEYKVSPPSPFAVENSCWDPFVQYHGFGYDQISHDYKVI